MGQKVHPESLRVGYIHDWKSTWFNERDFSDYLLEDIHIREHIENKLAHAGLSTITIKKNKNEVEVNIHTARPGIVIGKSGSEVDALRKELHKMTGKAVKVNILEIKRPELDARLVAQSIAEQLQNRVAFRRAMKRALTSAMRSGAKGCKIQVGGRLGGAEMARTESYSDGRVPLHTLRADIDYGFFEARTTTGRIGVKCWINKGEVMPEGFRSDLVSGEGDGQSVLAQAGLTVAQVEDMHRYLAIANYEDRFVIPTSHREEAEDAYGLKGSCGFTFGNGCDFGPPHSSLFGGKMGRRKLSPVRPLDT